MTHEITCTNGGILKSFKNARFTFITINISIRHINIRCIPNDLLLYQTILLSNTICVDLRLGINKVLSYRLYDYPERM